LVTTPSTLSGRVDRTRTLDAALDDARAVQDVPRQLGQRVWRVVVETHHEQRAVDDAETVRTRSVDVVCTSHARTDTER
jgi:hypothetical protein